MPPQPEWVQGKEERGSENGPSVVLALVWQVGFGKTEYGRASMSGSVNELSVCTLT